jgi:hypothetical protein
MKVNQAGGAACHEGYRSCFFRKVINDKTVIEGERIFDPSKVYDKGRNWKSLNRLVRKYMNSPGEVIL